MAKYVIVGGVAGGATAAARLRRLDEKSEIIMFERGKNISYANCGLPYYIGEKIKDRDKLFIQTPYSFKRRYNIDVRVKSEVIEIHRENKKVIVKDLKTNNIYEQDYDKIILSPGSKPLKPPIPGINNKGIFTLKKVSDTDDIYNFIKKEKPKRAVVVGAGFIGLEMAENLHKKGIFVTIVEMAKQVMSPLDYEMAAEVHQHLKMKKVEFYLKDAVKEFKKNKNKINVKLSSGRKIWGDMIILSIGVKPEITLAKKAGLKIGQKKGIIVNEFLQTSDPNIYAIGDAVEFKNPIIGKNFIHYLAGPTNRMGRMVADNIVLKKEKKYKGTIGTAIAKVFDLTVASTGISEKTLKEENIPYLASITHSASHAGYYPGAKPMSLKIVFSPKKGTLFGSQIVGYEGVDKRIDLIAAILKNKGTIYDLQEIEHAYAPPYSSAKDPVSIAGYVAENIIENRVKNVHWYDIENLRKNNSIFLDVRTPEEFEQGNIKDSINIPLDNLRARLEELPNGKNIIVYCTAGLRAYLANRILIQNNFNNVYNLSGGYKTFQFATQKQSNEDIFESDFIDKDDVIYQTYPSSLSKKD